VIHISWNTRSPGHHYIYSLDLSESGHYEKQLCFLVLLKDGRYVDYVEYFVKGGYKNDPRHPCG
jgi:hypothetical protein